MYKVGQCDSARLNRISLLILNYRSIEQAACSPWNRVRAWANLAHDLWCVSYIPWRIMFLYAPIMLCCNSLEYLYYASINFILLPHAAFLFMQYAYTQSWVYRFNHVLHRQHLRRLMPPRRFSANVNPKLCGEDFLWLKQSRGLYRSYDATSNSYYSPFCTSYLCSILRSFFFLLCFIMTLCFGVPLCSKLYWHITSVKA